MRLRVEDFRPTCRAKSAMARRAADAVIGATRTALTDRGRMHGRDIRLERPGGP